MAIDSMHPQFVEQLPAFVLCRDSIAGEPRIKAKREIYLTPTEGMKIDGMKPKQAGLKDYEKYLERAVFPDYMKDTLPVLTGFLNSKPPVIELPPTMEAIRENATTAGESLAILLQRIHLEQLSVGRLGLLADLPSEAVAGATPYIALYVAEAGQNWNDGEILESQTELSFVCLNETNVKMDAEFNWQEYKKYRLLRLKGGVYEVGVFDEVLGLDFDEARFKAPTYFGATSKTIPFLFINACDLAPAPDIPPLNGLATLCRSIYRSEADFRYHLHMMSQDTLVVTGAIRQLTENGEDTPLRIGAGSRIDVETGGDAKFIGVNSEGLAAQQKAIESDRRLAEAKGVQITADKTQVESGDALKRRIGAKTVSLKQIAITGAHGLEQILKKIAVWMNANPELVKVKPNLEFTDLVLTGSDLGALMNAKKQGAPISLASIHAIALESRLAKHTFEEEVALIAEEQANPVLTPPEPEPAPGKTESRV